MKKTLMTIILCAAMLQVQASPPYPVGMQVHLHVEVIGINPGSVGHQLPKSPVQPPIVYLDAHTLYLCSEHSGFTLVLKDTDETEVFSTNIPENTYTVLLPSTLSGEYTLELWDDTYVFSGDIEL